MSYKHNNLLAMRQKYWNDELSETVRIEKQFFQQILSDLGVFDLASLDDAKYLFFNLPSIIIVKGYALGFQHETVQSLIFKHIQTNLQQLKQRTELKIQYRM